MSAPVSKRIVFYLPGFDPNPPNRYREGYASEGAKQAEVSGYDLSVKRLSTVDATPRFQVDATINNTQVETEFRVLAWNDLVRQSMEVPIWHSLILMMQAGRVIANSGALLRLIRLHRPPNIAGLYPFVVIPLVALIGFLAGFLLLIWFGTLPAFIAGLATATAASIWFRRRDNIHLAYYILHDLALITAHDGYTPPILRDRLEHFKNQIADAFDENFDEIMVIGHSSGAHMAVIMVAELAREGRITDPQRFAFLTLGQAVPLVSYLPDAADLRLALAELAIDPRITWVDVTAPTDGVAFSLCDPISCSIHVDNQVNPLILSAAFTNTLSPAYRARLKWRFFRQHFQYICHFDQPDHYDYFQVTAGPQRLRDRYAGYDSSPSTKRRNLNPYQSQRA